MKMSLAGNAPLASKDGKALSHKNVRDRINFTISLNPRNQDELTALLASLYDPNSPNYKHFLTPEQYKARFGPSVDDIEQVKNYLAQNGLTTTSVTPEGTVINASGSVENVQKAFNVTINNYRNASGQVYYANKNTPSIPSMLSGIIVGIQGLDNEPHWQVHVQKTSHPQQDMKSHQASHLGSGPVGGYTPAEIRSAYDATPLTNAGVTGSGQTVALFELDGFKQPNITTYDTHYGLGSPTPSTVLVDGYNGAAGDGEGEVELDIEVIHAIAPKANVMVYEGPNTDSSAIDVYQKIASDNKAKIVSASWGLSERLSNAATMNSMHNIFEQMAAQGQSVYAASGDSGAYDGGSSDPNALAVDSPANDPLVTGVGGSHLVVSNGAYGSESVWSNTSDGSGGGGGISTVYAKPSWQVGPGTTNSYSNGKRQVPDVSADADPSTGYSVYSGGQWDVYGGTSAAAPLWAGITALNNQYAVAHGKSALGQANPSIYKIFNSTQTYKAFHDITTGTNLYYPAAAGYDEASGIGTPDVYNLIRDLNDASSSGGTSTGGGTTGTSPTSSASQLIQNGGFENGRSPWVIYSSGGFPIVGTRNPHSGAYSAFFAGYNNATETMYQTVTIPSTVQTATISYWSYVYTHETSHPYDDLKVQVRDANGNVLRTLQTQSDATAAGWRSQMFDLSAYKGKTVRIFFLATTDASKPTSFYVDDVKLTVK